MSQIEQIISWFKARGGSATLREILTSGEPWSYEWRARATDLRHRTNYDLVLERGKKASDNLYRLIEKVPPVRFVEEDNGQLRIAI